MSTIPQPMRSRILRLRKWQDVHACVYGKLLLKRILNDFDLDLPLEKLKYSEFQRPYFEVDGFDFNISHSNCCVVCAGSTETKLGVDIELMTEIHLDDLKSQFHPQEWRQVYYSEDKLSTFYRYWTRKEALIKADGRGLQISLAEIDVSKENIEVVIGETNWSLLDIDLMDKYKCALASTKSDLNLKISEINPRIFLVKDFAKDF
ncbi:MAG: 4'-phosphopantetheinyl transferase superfamily protein [Cyclobacteriaceae bacterium]